MTLSKPSKPSGIESLPVEVIDQITSYHAGSRAFLKNLRLVRPFHKSASALVCHTFRFTLTPSNPNELEEVCKTTFVDYVETLHLELNLSVYLFSKNQWDETTAQAAMDCIERCLKLFPRLKHLTVICPPHWGGYYRSTAARPDILQSVMTAFTLSPPPTLTTLDIRFPERLKLTQPAGADDDANPSRGIAPWVANLHSISLTFDQQYKHKDDAVCELLQHGANLETVRLRRYTRLSNTPRLLIHHKAPLECLTLEDVTISGESLAYTIASFKRTVTRMVLVDVNLSDGRWDDVLLELSTCQNLVVLDICPSMGYARGDQNYGAMLALFRRCRVIEDQARARKVARSHD
ncbi:hypothetical protein ATEIFO6365_0002053800 [Aspergillus terreus]|uniref:Uncharacterized protein n=1 Tax=Aspergillus terreus TaxID=33178 RepID=A0A5M3YWP5_ASPTE|nr:hypothetical protein ATETN484_0004053800 [Aspergillus terreus]GFF13427.1 hypothetical protein ATEIFO6365_0002053800 [Aspergillus terreus]